MVAYGGITGTDSDKTGAVTLISSQVTAPFSTHILIDGYDIPKPAGRGSGGRVRVDPASVRSPCPAGHICSVTRSRMWPWPGCSATAPRPDRGAPPRAGVIVILAGDARQRLRRPVPLPWEWRCRRG